MNNNKNFEGGIPRPVYLDPAASIDVRVKDLLSRMTLEEKVAQMTTVWQGKGALLEGFEFSADCASDAFPNNIGQIGRPSDKSGYEGTNAAGPGTLEACRTPEETVRFVNAVQDWATQKTRLGIPVLFHEECLHGYMATEATMFPQAIALAGTFDIDLMREVSRVIAREVRARGVPFVLSPVVDIVRDPRWGRIEETFGEDPFLTGEMGVAAVEGLQGTGKFERLAEGRVFATLKHMTGHGQPESGINVGPAQISERELRENFFPPFKAIVERTSICSVMPSYNEIDGVPSHANSWLLNSVLRKEWGFDGIIVSDYVAVAELETLHHIAENQEQAARLAVGAGVDFEMPDGVAFPTLVEQVRKGQISQTCLDVAVSRILTVKFRAGLFEDPYGSTQLTKAITGNQEARDLALRAARKSICLLTNDGTLPLINGDKKRIAVIGPNSDIARLGGYSSLPKQTISLLDGLRSMAGGGTEITFARGVRITQSDNRTDDEVVLADIEENRRLIIEAVETARRSDVIVLAIGDTEQVSREAFASTHLGDRADLDLVGEQNELFLALHSLGIPIVVCAINGRPPSWPTVVGKANAVLECWYPGQEGGTAMAEAVFGLLNPGAKLPVTVVQHEGQIPLFYNHKPSARRGYLFEDHQPLFCFGHGLSYTKFEISEPRLSTDSLKLGNSVTVSVAITNVGECVGDEVIQLYIRDVVASVTQPLKLLKGFRRVTLESGESKEVIFELTSAAFEIWNIEMEQVVEPGEFEIMVGANSKELKSTTLTISEKAVTSS